MENLHNLARIHRNLCRCSFHIIKSKGSAGLCIFLTCSSPACALCKTTDSFKETHFVNRARGAVWLETRVTGNLIILCGLLWGKSKCFGPRACMWHLALSLMRRSFSAEPVLRPADLAEFGPRVCFLTVHIFTNLKYSRAVSFDKAKLVLSALSHCFTKQLKVTLSWATKIMLLMTAGLLIWVNLCSQLTKILLALKKQ